jgi:hypothetical protein
MSSDQKDVFVVMDADAIPPHIFGGWLYGPISEFIHANMKELPPEISKIGYGRIGFVLHTDRNMLGDALIVADKRYTIHEVQVMDYWDQRCLVKKQQEGLLLCLPLSNQSSDSNQSNEELVKP